MQSSGDKRTGNYKGAVAEAAIAYEAVRLGVGVFKPLSEHSRADLVFELGSRLFRVQCKTARRTGAVLAVNLISSWYTPGGRYVRNRYQPGELDLVAAHCAELGRNFLIPFELVAGMTAIHLRLSPPKNGQQASIHLASAYDFTGAVAQLAERRDGIAKAGGSNPPSSTPQEPTALTVGAHEFRCHFGWYMERAAAGEEITVTRRGKPTVRLVAHQPELRAPAE
jgi:prevent-host-death family protein